VIAFISAMLSKFDAFQIATEFHWACKALVLRYAMKDQLVRASSSIALTLAEGAGKRTPAEQRHFYSMALASLRECQAVVHIEKIEDPDLNQLADRLGAMLYKLVKKELK
jgi:four helix bundle protein